MTLHQTNPNDDAIVESLPKQEEFYRAPARFGNIPVEAEPKGWDRQRGFSRHYPRVNLPTQITERVELGMSADHEPNRLIWGDNLHVMRQISTNSVDLIYIDPPFFSGREYNVIWGDDNELRSFNDIWEGGLDGYLIWLNARLYEMKRMLKPTGSIYVHCDWHASHYIKVEMDKIFGYENFRNEVVWQRAYGGKSSQFQPRSYGHNHDAMLFYAKTNQVRCNPFRELTEQERTALFPLVDNQGRRYHDRGELYRRASQGARPNLCYNFRGFDAPRPQGWRLSRVRMEEEYNRGRIVVQNGAIKRLVFEEDHRGNPLGDIWTDINFLSGSNKERIGYPTQKPEALLERIIETSSNEGDLVADFFIGGGTTAAVAQRLGRRFIVCDQSRVAVAVTAERLKQQAQTQGMGEDPVPDFTVEQWGIYEADRVSRMSRDEFREFVLICYGARVSDDKSSAAIHGWQGALPIWVGAPDMDSQASARDVQDFANAIGRTVEYRDANLRDGVMLAWGFSRDARNAADQLRRREEVDVNFVRLKQVTIDHADFRERIVSRSTDRADYSEFLTFIQPPVVNVGSRALSGRSVSFDAGDSAVLNSGAEIINVQWDFNYDGRRFSATQGYSFTKKQGSGKKKRPQLKVEYKFPRAGHFNVACRVQDSRGGEAMWTGRVEVK